MKKRYLGHHTIYIMGNKWDVYFKTDKQYAHLNSPGSRALTITRAKELHFNVDVCYPKDNVAVHELVHAFAFENGYHDLPLNNELQEESFCVLFEMRGSIILETAKPITKLLHKYIKQAERHRKGKSTDEEQDSNV